MIRIGRTGGLTWAQKLSISLRSAWEKARKSGLPFALGRDKHMREQPSP